MDAQPEPRPAPQIVAQQPALAPVRPYTLPPVDEFRLANGLRVVAVRQTAVPMVTARLILDAGAEHEPAARNGLAVLTASLLPEGTAAMSGPELAERMERLGAQFQTGAGQNLAFVVGDGAQARVRRGAGAGGGDGDGAGLSASATSSGCGSRPSPATCRRRPRWRGWRTETFCARRVRARGAVRAPRVGGTAASLRHHHAATTCCSGTGRMYVPANATLLLVGDLARGRGAAAGGAGVRRVAGRRRRAWRARPTRCAPSRPRA